MLRYAFTLILALVSASAMAVKPSIPVDPPMSSDRPCADTVKAAMAASAIVTAGTGQPAFGTFAGLTVATYRRGDRCAATATIAAAGAAGATFLVLPTNDGVQATFVKRF